ncbi:MAG: peptide chain release factor 2 [Oscillospiraceae bacterium]|jgi:peptide chain release factor 2|nr:peptide chain release factor 2 [Oscillospiraceae bacterium]
MLQSDDLRFCLSEISVQLKDLSEALNLDCTKLKIVDLEKEISKEGFWNDKEKSQKILKLSSFLKSKIECYEKLLKSFNYINDLVQLAKEEYDDFFIKEANDEFILLKKGLEKQKLSVLLSGEFDSKNAILTLHSGAGGTEAQDWVEMLLRMYSRYCQKEGFKVRILDFLDGEEAGLKSVSFFVEGINAYGYLKGEAGVHRLVRVSPFDSSGRRHTSFASVEVIPELDNDNEVEISSDDLKMDVFRATGAGGQHVNKTSSAVRLTHIPTGIIASCQNERSQKQNREMALKMIKSKLLEIKERNHLKKIEDIKGEQKEIAWGSQIRSYVFMPYTLVKDHITGFETGNISSIMNGEIDGFINAYLKNFKKSD